MSRSGSQKLASFRASSATLRCCANISRLCGRERCCGMYGRLYGTGLRINLLRSRRLLSTCGSRARRTNVACIERKSRLRSISDNACLFRAMCTSGAIRTLTEDCPRDWPAMRRSCVRRCVSFLHCLICTSYDSGISSLNRWISA